MILKQYFSSNMLIFCCILAPLQKALSSKYKDTQYKDAYTEMM